MDERVVCICVQFLLVLRSGQAGVLLQVLEVDLVEPGLEVLELFVGLDGVLGEGQLLYH